MSGLFGTDGIRGIANQYPITAEMGLILGRAVVNYCRSKGLSTDIVTGRDTRISGEMLEHAVVAGILSAGGNAFMAGVIPTPGVACVTREAKAGAGIVLSASHNPHEYNGFKLFFHDGFKLSDEEEEKIENMILSAEKMDVGNTPGRSEIMNNADDLYLGFLEKCLGDSPGLSGLKVVLDCANGATFKIAPRLFKSMGIDTKVVFANPDGININLDCGSQHTETLSKKVLEAKADAGLAFDGDGDRLIAVDEKGMALTGDQLMTIYAKVIHRFSQLKNNLVVSTVMSNIGLKSALKEFGATVMSTKVGDRYVIEEMKKLGAVLGGEDSGHIIFLGPHTTGDGMLAGLKLLSAMKILDMPLSGLSKLMTVFPQELINVEISEKPDISGIPEIIDAIAEIEETLGEKGRVLVRYSGTEPLCRVMVEGEDRDEILRHARKIAEVIKIRLNP